MSSSVNISGADLPEEAYSNHGRTQAAWVTNGGITLGSLVAGIGFTIWELSYVWIGAGVVTAALIVGGVMKSMGKGQPS